MPFACIFVPDFPVRAVVRVEPDLRHRPVAVFAGTPPLTKVFSCNEAARKLGAEIGMTKVQAEAFTGITWRWRSLSQEATAHNTLLDCAWTISPRVEDGTRCEQDLPDTVVLDLAGCEKLFGSPSKIACDLQKIAFEAGFDANIAVAGNFSAAVCAAQGLSGVTVIPDGEESSYLGKLSLAALRIPFELEATLKRWGIQNAAEFAALPEISVVERLGQEGHYWQKLARGADTKTLIAKDFPSHFEECMELESPVELLEPLLFLLNRLLDQLCLRLRMHILAISEIQVTLILERNDSRTTEPASHIRTLRLPTPAQDSKLLLKFLRLDLEVHPPASPVTALSMLVVPAKTRSRQFGLFLPLSPDAHRLEVTLARIQNTVGEGRVGSPMLLGTHRPNAFAQNRFVLPEEVVRRSVFEKQATAAIRMYRPPLPANVELHEDTPAHLSCEGVRREILAFAGPWRTAGDWWAETNWARDEWEVEIRALRPKPHRETGKPGEETALYRIYKDLHSNNWFVEGIYD